MKKEVEKIEEIAELITEYSVSGGACLEEAAKLLNSSADVSNNDFGDIRRELNEMDGVIDDDGCLTDRAIKLAEEFIYLCEKEQFKKAVASIKNWCKYKTITGGDNGYPIPEYGIFIEKESYKALSDHDCSKVIVFDESEKKCFYKYGWQMAQLNSTNIDTSDNGVEIDGVMIWWKDNENLQELFYE
jgi:hypothetical protein